MRFTVASTGVWLSTLAGGRRIGPMAFAFFDQGCFSLTNFLTSIVVARAVSPEEYAVFSLAFSAYILLLTIQYGLVLEPTSVLGAQYSDSANGLFLHGALLFNVAFSLVAGSLVGLLLPAFSPTTTSLRPAGLLIAAISPITLSAYLLRRVCYLFDLSQVAALSSFASLCATVAGLVSLTRLHLLTTVSALLVLGASACMSLAIMFLPLSKVTHCFVLAGTSARALYGLCLQFWHYGKWSAGSYLMTWVCASGYLLALSRFDKLSSLAGFRVIEIFFQPLGQISAAGYLVLLPDLARLVSTSQVSKAIAQAAFGAAAMQAFTLAYVLSVFVAAPALLTLLYPGKEYSLYLWLVPYFGLVYLLRVVSDFGIAQFLRARRRPHLTFFATASGAAATVLIGFPLCAAFGLRGAAWGRTFSTVLELCVAIIVVRASLANRASTASVA